MKTKHHLTFFRYCDCGILQRTSSNNIYKCWFCNFYIYLFHGRIQDFGWGKNTFGGRPRGGTPHENRKIEFFIIFGKIVTKNRAFVNNIIFLQQFFSVSGGFPPPPSPLATPLILLEKSIVWFLFGKMKIKFFKRST